MDRRRNDKIREDLEIESLHETLDENTFNRFRHLVRMTEQKPTKYDSSSKVEENKS